MKYQININGSKVLLSSTQLDILTDAIDGADVMNDKYVGKGNGNFGHETSYIVEITSKRLHEWLQVTPITEDFIESTKLAQKLAETK